MKEGWHNDEYLISFEDIEIEEKEKQYEIGRLLPNHRLLGIIGWDDFLVMDRTNQKLFRVPTVPIAQKEKREWPHSVDLAALKSDERFQGKVKWYTKPIIFGGDPNPGENLIWITHEDHIKAVKYWNQIYLDVTAKQ